ncbi:hypothetical protein J6590_004668 [Homalodisca vitripennis]|nr:hypothetical protein J6590_004668 [Homalodisca vitripennis]
MESDTNCGWWLVDAVAQIRGPVAAHTAGQCPRPRPSSRRDVDGVVAGEKPQTGPVPGTCPASPACDTFSKYEET